jgi:hypothetical protein
MTRHPLQSNASPQLRKITPDDTTTDQSIISSIHQIYFQQSNHQIQSTSLKLQISIIRDPPIPIPPIHFSKDELNTHKHKTKIMDIDDILASVTTSDRLPQRTADLQALTRAWVAERCAPELLPYPEELIERVMERVKLQVSLCL